MRIIMPRFSRFIILSLILAGAFLSSQSVNNARAEFHFNMVWSYFQFNDEGNKGRMTSNITIGIPETDNSAGFASCFAGSTAGSPELVIFAGINNLPAGAPIDIEFFADAGPMVYRGQVKLPENDEDYSGVRLNLAGNDPLWSVLSRMPGIRFSVQGQAGELPLRGSSAAIGNFLSDCNIYQSAFTPSAPSSPAPPPPQPFDPRWATCDQLANEVSRNSDTPLSVTFVNKSDGYRAVMWIGFDGIPKDYAGLNPGEKFTINTYLTHPWMFTDGPGNCLEMFMPQLGVSVFNITAPNRDFGPE